MEGAIRDDERVPLFTVLCQRACEYVQDADAEAFHAALRAVASLLPEAQEVTQVVVEVDSSSASKEGSVRKRPSPADLATSAEWSPCDFNIVKKVVFDGRRKKDENALAYFVCR